MSDPSTDLGKASMRPIDPPEGGYEPIPGPTVRDLNVLPVPHGRDVQTDCRTISDVDAGGKNITDDRDLDDVGFLSNMDVTSLGTEKRRGGWDPLATPNGGDMGGIPRVVNTSGTRGARDIGAVDPDGSMP